MKNQLMAYSCRRKQIETVRIGRRLRLNFFHVPLAQKHHLLITPLPFCPYQENAKQKSLRMEKRKNDDALINDSLPQGHYRNTQGEIGFVLDFEALSPNDIKKIGIISR